MRFKLLGDSGLRVSEFALGTMSFGIEADDAVGRNDSYRIFDIFRSAGGNFIDTADVYENGDSERLLSELLNDERDAIVLGTKYTFASRTPDPNAGGNHRKHLVQAVDASLKRLRTDRLDLLWVNGWDFMTPEHEVMRALDDLVTAGKVLYLGVANTPAWIVSRCNMLAEWRGRAPFVGLQVRYNLADRSADRELLPMARALDLGVVGCSSLNGGQLAGSHRNSRSSRLDPVVAIYKIDQDSAMVAEVLDTVAGETGYTAAQVALAWVRDRGVIPVIGARTSGQITENLGALEVSLSVDQVDRLTKASAIELGYPHDYLRLTREATFAGMYERIDRHRDRGAGLTRYVVVRIAGRRQVLLHEARGILQRDPAGQLLELLALQEGHGPPLHPDERRTPKLLNGPVEVDRAEAQGVGQNILRQGQGEALAVSQTDAGEPIRQFHHEVGEAFAGALLPESRDLLAQQHLVVVSRHLGRESQRRIHRIGRHRGIGDRLGADRLDLGESGDGTG